MYLCVICESQFNLGSYEPQSCECGMEFTAEHQQADPGRYAALLKWWKEVEGMTPEQAEAHWKEQG